VKSVAERSDILNIDLRKSASRTVAERSDIFNVDLQKSSSPIVAGQIVCLTLRRWQLSIEEAFLTCLLFYRLSGFIWLKQFGLRLFYPYRTRSQANFFRIAGEKDFSLCRS
jgi:hypothetical protein